ncbi:MAG: thiamine pyrophosphate-binding protein [Gammaproteobacteria bacterium]|nr:thiamine pyrophosphate-binding protein [Gammaproteobacteria bacterium]
MDAKRSGGEILIQGLIRHGVETVFCVPGESYLTALDALYDEKERIRTITCRQEGGAAYMAEAYGKLTGHPGVCFVSRGPGAANAMVGIHTAFQDSTPVLMFIGQISRGDFGREAFQELDFTQVYRSVAKRVIRIDDARRIPEQLNQAWQVAMHGRPGPVVLELPEDMLRDRVGTEDTVPGFMSHPGPDPEAVSMLSEMLKKSERPVVVAGGAAWTPTASRYLLRFIETQHLPVATAFRRTDSFDNTHPSYIGELGLGTNPKLFRQIQSADLLIVVGPRLGDMTTSGYTLLDNPKRAAQKLVHIHVSDEEVNSVYQADLGIVAQPEQFLKAACKIPAVRSDTNDFIATGNRNYRDFMKAPRNVGAAMRMDKVTEFLRERLPGDAIITSGAGNYTTWTSRHYQFRQPRTQLAPTNGSMGYGVPAAVAAKIANPEAIVVSLSGDGCFLMNGQEFSTAVQYRLNILFLVINNGCYGTIRTHQERHYPGRSIATTLHNPDFAALADAYGGLGLCITKTEQFAPVFEQALFAGKPALIEIQTDY